MELKASIAPLRDINFAAVYGAPLEEFTPQPHQPSNLIGLDLELLNWALGNTLKLDAPNTSLRVLSGASFRGWFSSSRSCPVGLYG